MDNDIDIEEHDVLDNPMIRTMFPDISQIKSEVPDFDIEDADVHPGFSSQICYEDNPLDDYNNEHHSDDDNEMDYSEDGTDNPELFYHSNKMIIGSKPNLKIEVVLPETDLYLKALYSDAHVQLEDWSVILQTHPFYCKDCGILFPTNNSLDAHNMTAHSFLVEVNDSSVIRRNFAKKSTVVHKTVDSKPCFHCKRIFPNVDALTQHLYEVLGVKMNIEVKVEPCDAFKCPTCGTIFKDDKFLLKHLKTNHEYSGEDVAEFSTAIPIVFDCQHCKSSMSSIKSLNAHIRLKHSTQFFMTSNTSTLGYKCIVCKKVFERYTEARSHRKSLHPHLCNRSIIKKVVRKPVVPKVEPEKPVKEGEISQKSLRRTFDVSLYNQSRTVELTNAPIPKSVLFRCKKCNIHFISASLSMRHFPVCIKGCSKYTECQRCDRMIRFQDRHIHEQQHNLSYKIKVYDISIRVLERTLCKCPKCDSCYDDRDFWTHFDKCGVTEPHYCDKCDVLISDLNFDAHKFKHENKINDFIVINLVSLDDSKTEVRYKQVNRNRKNRAMKAKANLAQTKTVQTKTVPTKIVQTKTVPTKIVQTKTVPTKIVQTKFFNKPKSKIKLPLRNPKLTLRYCDLCECSFATLKHNKVYPNCKHIARHVCPDCGLYFTTSMFKRHKDIHKQKKITLLDYKFIKLIDNSPVIPKAPEYPKCQKCNVYFVQRSEIILHKCPGSESKICSVCKKSFGKKAFKLHTQYHLYEKMMRDNDDVEPKNDMPVLLKKYELLEKMWNILYMCIDCKSLTDCYDHAVGHSQDHLNGLVYSNKAFVKTCKKCNLNFELKAYKRHKQLHRRSVEITRNSFKILNYNHRDLIKGAESWIKLFDDLPKENINCIVSRSMYSVTNNVRMKVLRVGTGSTFYQCATCKNYIGENLVYSHTHEEKCSVEDHNQKTAQIGKHSKIVSFKNEFDAEFDRRLKIEKPSTLKKPKVSKLYDVYRCENCGVTVIHKQNRKRHKCSSRATWHCMKCDQLYSIVLHAKHDLFHQMLPNFTKDTINVIPFIGNDKTKIKVKMPPKIAAKIKNKVFKPGVEKSVPVTKVYRCTLCGLHFTSLLIIAKHFDICHRETIPSSECSRCKLLFPTDILVSHLVKHHRERDWKIIVEDVEPRMKQVKLFECAGCSLLFSLKTNALKHKDCGKNSGKQCNDCNLIFHTNSFDNHECTEYIENDILIVNREREVTDGTKTIEKATSKDTVKDPREVIYDRLRQTIFKCDMCNVHFCNIEIWYRHIESDHVMKWQTATCDQCQIIFSSSKSLVNHQKLHHKNKVPCLVRVMDADSIIEMKASKSRKYALNSEFDEAVGKSYSVSSKMYSMMLRSRYDNTLYACNQCPQHFITRATWFKHIYSAANHDFQVVKCQECDYTFIDKSLLRHQFIHHRVMKLNRDNIDVIHFDKPLPSIDDAESTGNSLIKSDMSVDADSNDYLTDNAAKRPKYSSNMGINSTDDEHVVSSSTMDV